MSIELTPSLADLVDPLPGHALRAAATLRLADLIAAGADTAPALAAAARADEDAMARLMRYLCSRGIFQAHEGRYALTEFSELLLDEDPSGLRRTLDLDSYGDRFDRAVAELVDVVRSGEPSYPRLYGSTVYDDLAADPALGAVFADVRGLHSAGYGEDVAAVAGWSSCRRVVDLGGGTGSVLLAVLERHPSLSGAVLDLPYVAPQAKEALQASAFAQRCEFIEGSFFDPLPPADRYLLCNVLFNWDDAQAGAILARCAEAGPVAGVVVAERLIDPDAEVELAAAQDLRLLAVCGGRQRGTAEFEALGAAHGLALTSVTPTASGMSLLRFDMCRAGSAGGEVVEKP